MGETAPIWLAAESNFATSNRPSYLAMRALSFAFALTLFLASFTSALAQSSPALLAANETAAPSPASTTMLITGRVESAAGPLVGAVVSVAGKAYQKAVTNMDGEFRLTLPATTEAVSILASYAGFKDVAATVQPGTTLAPLQLTETQSTPDLPRKLQLKRYIKVAQKEAKRESRQLHRD